MNAARHILLARDRNVPVPRGPSKKCYDAAMTSTRTTHMLLAAITVFLGVIALRPIIVPETVHSQVRLSAHSAPEQIPIGFSVFAPPSAVMPPYTPVQQTPLSEGITLLDPGSGNIWSYPMYQATVSSSGTVYKQIFGSPTLIGTFNGPGQAMSAP
jgi:hypothetical protein